MSTEYMFKSTDLLKKKEERSGKKDRGRKEEWREEEGRKWC